MIGQDQNLRNDSPDVIPARPSHSSSIIHASVTVSRRREEHGILLWGLPDAISVLTVHT